MSCAAFSFAWEGLKGVHLESWWLADSNGEDLSSTTSADLEEGSYPNIKRIIAIWDYLKSSRLRRDNVYSNCNNIYNE
jgi:hypothetical protein